MRDLATLSHIGLDLSGRFDRRANPMSCGVPVETVRPVESVRSVEPVETVESVTTVGRWSRWVGPVE
jgi:hypothetical protein